MRSFAPITARTSAWLSKIMKQAQHAGVLSPARIHSIFMTRRPDAMRSRAESPCVERDVTPQTTFPARVPIAPIGGGVIRQLSEKARNSPINSIGYTDQGKIVNSSMISMGGKRNSFCDRAGQAMMGDDRDPRTVTGRVLWWVTGRKCR